MISAAFWISLGVILGAFIPDRARDLIQSWVRDGASWAWAFVRGKPAPSYLGMGAVEKQSASQNTPREQVWRTETGGAGSGGRIAPAARATFAGIAGAADSLLTSASNLFSALWRWKWAILVLLFFTLGVGLMRGCAVPSMFGKSRGELRLEREIAEANTRIAEHEARLGEMSRDLAVNTERDARRVGSIIAQANEGIEDAVEAVDADALYFVYRDAYERVWDDLALAGEPDPAPRRPDAVRGAGASPV